MITAGLRSVTGIASGRSVPWLLDHRARHRGDHPFLIWEPFDGTPQVWTYADFAAAVAAVAGGLAAHGVGRGERVVLHLDNCPEFLLAWFAIIRLGAVAVCTNTRSAAVEVAYYVAHCGARLAITQPSLTDHIVAALPADGLMLVVAPNGDFAALLDAPPAAAAPVGDLDAASIQYTSGTTGRPKAVIWTHANCLWGGKVNAAHEKLGPADIQLVYAPLFHTNAQAYSVLACLWSGASFVLQPRFSSSRYWDVSVRRHCTFASQLYFTLRALSGLAVPDNHAYRLWGTGMTGHPIAERLGVPTIGWWGMTETISHPIVGDADVPERPGTIGRAASEYEIDVVGENGRSVAAGTTGDLLVRGVRGVSLFAGYLNDPAATAAAFDARGWFVTGDRVTPHDDGGITFADRAKDMLRVGSENVAASEIERVVASVAGVAEAAVVGAPDAMLDEVPVAFIVVRPGTADPSDAVLTACRAQLAAFKVPREVRIVAQLPRVTLEKVAKHQLRELLRDEAAIRPVPANRRQTGPVRNER